MKLNSNNLGQILANKDLVIEGDPDVVTSHVEQFLSDLRQLLQQNISVLKSICFNGVGPYWLWRYLVICTNLNTVALRTTNLSPVSQLIVWAFYNKGMRQDSYHMLQPLVMGPLSRFTQPLAELAAWARQVERVVCESGHGRELSITDIPAMPVLHLGGVVGGLNPAAHRVRPQLPQRDPRQNQQMYLDRSLFELVAPQNETLSVKGSPKVGSEEVHRIVHLPCVKTISLDRVSVGFLQQLQEQISIQPRPYCFRFNQVDEKMVALFAKYVYWGKVKVSRIVISNLSVEATKAFITMLQSTNITSLGFEYLSQSALGQITTDSLTGVQDITLSRMQPPELDIILKLLLQITPPPNVRCANDIERAYRGKFAKLGQRDLIAEPQLKFAEVVYNSRLLLEYVDVSEVDLYSESIELNASRTLLLRCGKEGQKDNANKNIQLLGQKLPLNKQVEHVIFDDVPAKVMFDVVRLLSADVGVKVMTFRNCFMPNIFTQLQDQSRFIICFDNVKLHNINLENDLTAVKGLLLRNQLLFGAKLETYLLQQHNLEVIGFDGLKDNDINCLQAIGWSADMVLVLANISINMAVIVRNLLRNSQEKPKLVLSTNDNSMQKIFMELYQGSVSDLFVIGSSNVSVPKNPLMVSHSTDAIFSRKKIKIEPVVNDKDEESDADSDDNTPRGTGGRGFWPD